MPGSPCVRTLNWSLDAYSLGESSLGETLVARRQALEASLAESIARIDANEARYRLLLDAHQLWIDNDQHEAH